MSDNNKSEPATKADLKELAQTTKSDLKELAQTTKSDLKELAQTTKNDLTDALTKLKTEFNHTIEKVYLSQVQADSRLEQKMDKMMDKMDKLYSNTMSSYEKTVLKGKMYDQKAETHSGMLIEQGDKILNHENRITVLETGK